MEHHYSFVGKLQNISDMEDKLSKNSSSFLEQCKGLGGLYKMLSLPYIKIPTSFLSKVLDFYDPHSNTFNINGNVLGVTLQDVLFLVRIRIDGEPVLIKNYNDDHCISIFGKPMCEFDELKAIIKDTQLDAKKRKVALLMLIVNSIIMSSHNGNRFYPAFFELLSDPDMTSMTYAWGAAMLAALQSPLEERDKKVDGCAWLLVCFFFVRIPMLWDAICLTSVRREMEEGQLAQDPFPMEWILRKLLPSTFGKDQKGGYLKKMSPVFENLEATDIILKPYSNWVLQDELKEDRKFITRLSPLFCNNHVVQHKPHNVTNQLGAHQLHPILHRDSFDIINHRIRVIDNRGSNGHDYFNSYKKEVAMWYKKECLEVNDDSTYYDVCPNRQRLPQYGPRGRNRRYQDLERQKSTRPSNEPERYGFN